MTLRIVLLAIGLFAPTLSLAQAYCDPRVDAACYQRWCRAQGGTPVYRGNWGCQMSGASSGGYSGGSSGAELGRQIGGMLGSLLREGLFGNPQEDAQRQAAMEEQRRLQEQENQRRAEEIARQDEARYQRLRASLLEFSPAPPLSLIGTSQGSGGGLQLLMGEEAERSSNPALAELTRAAAWSTLAARAPTPEDAVMLADAAFQSLIGGKVDLPSPPPDVKGTNVHPMLPEIEPLKKRYLELQPQLPNAMKPVFDAEQRAATFRRLEAESLALERSSMQAAQKAKAREAAKEARLLRQKAEAELRATQAEFARQQLAANNLEQSLRAWLSSFATGERKENSYYFLGFEDGSQCFSQNAGPRCDKARAPKVDYENCLASYRRGYSAGNKLRKDLLDHAYQWGGRDGATGVYEITDQRANGPCRYDFVMAYNRGYFGAQASQIASVKETNRTGVPIVQPPSKRVLSEHERVMNGITDYAKRLGWTPQEQDRLRKALNEVSMPEESYPPDAVIKQSWREISVRSADSPAARDAAKGEGPGLFGAGTQQGNEDCAIFALATASGQPYGVVAARATQIIREGEWRSAHDRANPQGVFRKKEDPGLMGGEVIMLAEGFGQAEIVKHEDFAQTLKAGRPVMVNVVPRSGNIKAGHQIVLAKTFQHRGETWYEAIDSTQGPMRRLYMSAEELKTLLHENGVAYRSEPGGTPALLRSPGR